MLYNIEKGSDVMKYFIKKNIAAVIIAIVVFIGVIVGNFFYAHTYDTDIFSIEKFQIEAVVNENGSMSIKERMTVEFDDDANGEFWRDIVTSKNNNGVSTNTSSNTKTIKPAIPINIKSPFLPLKSPQAAPSLP